MVRHSAVVRTVLLAGLLSGISISISHADTVYLKSGISISVTKAQEKDGQIEYWVGSTRYTISKDKVLKIEKGTLQFLQPAGYSLESRTLLAAIPRLRLRSMTR